MESPSLPACGQFDDMQENQILVFLVGFIDVGDGCWRPNVLLPRFGCW